MANKQVVLFAGQNYEEIVNIKMKRLTFYIN